MAYVEQVQAEKQFGSGIQQPGFQTSEWFLPLEYTSLRPLKDVITSLYAANIFIDGIKEQDVSIGMEAPFPVVSNDNQLLGSVNTVLPGIDLDPELGRQLTQMQRDAHDVWQDSQIQWDRYIGTGISENDFALKTVRDRLTQQYNRRKDVILHAIEQLIAPNIKAEYILTLPEPQIDTPPSHSQYNDYLIPSFSAFDSNNTNIPNNHPILRVFGAAASVFMGTQPVITTDLRPAIVRFSHNAELRDALQSNDDTPSLWESLQQGLEAIAATLPPADGSETASNPILNALKAHVQTLFESLQKNLVPTAQAAEPTNHPIGAEGNEVGNTNPQPFNMTEKSVLDTFAQIGGGESNGFVYGAQRWGYTNADEFAQRVGSDVVAAFQYMASHGADQLKDPKADDKSNEGKRSSPALFAFPQGIDADSATFNYGTSDHITIASMRVETKGGKGVTTKSYTFEEGTQVDLLSQDIANGRVLAAISNDSSSDLVWLSYDDLADLANNDAQNRLIVVINNPNDPKESAVIGIVSRNNDGKMSTYENYGTTLTYKFAALGNMSPELIILLEPHVISLLQAKQKPTAVPPSPTEAPIETAVPPTAPAINTPKPPNTPTPKNILTPKDTVNELAISIQHTAGYYLNFDGSEGGKYNFDGFVKSNHNVIISYGGSGGFANKEKAQQIAGWVDWLIDHSLTLKSDFQQHHIIAIVNGKDHLDPNKGAVGSNQLFIINGVHYWTIELNPDYYDNPGQFCYPDGLMGSYATGITWEGGVRIPAHEIAGLKTETPPNFFQYYRQIFNEASPSMTVSDRIIWRDDVNWRLDNTPTPPCGTQLLTPSQVVSFDLQIILLQNILNRTTNPKAIGDIRLQILTLRQQIKQSNQI